MIHIAIVGSGQLARMMAQSVLPEQYSFSFLAEANESVSCVEGLGQIVRREPNDSPEALFEKLGKPQVVSVEKEFVDCDLLAELNKLTQVHPNPKFLTIPKHRALEKNYLKQHNIPTVAFEVADTTAGLQQAIEKLDFPVIVKSTQEGYDGQNQWHINDENDLTEFLANNANIPEVIIEQKVSFDLEVSIIAVRAQSDEIRFYPLTHNTHKNGVLLTSVAPYESDNGPLTQQAQSIATTIMQDADYVGVLSVEFFVMNGQLYVNEMAPRVHNSGHWTMDGTDVSQFENHIRAITNQPLGNTQLTQPTAMINLLGITPKPELLTSARQTLYDYEKRLRPGRKMGHINITDAHGIPQADIDAIVKKIYG